MISTYRTIWSLLDASLRRRFLWLIALMVLTGLLDLAGVAVILPFLVVLANPDVVFSRPEFATLYEVFGFTSSFSFLQFLSLAIFVLVIGGIAVRALTSYYINRFVRSTVMSLSHRRLEGYLSQPYEWFLTQHSAQLSKSVLQEITEVVTGSIAPATRLIPNGLLLILLIAFLIAVEPVGALVIGTTFLFGFYAILKMLGQRLGHMGEDRLAANRERQQVVGEAFTGIKELKVLGLEQTYLQRYLVSSRSLVRHQTALILIGELPRYLIEALAFGGMLLFLLYLLWSRDGALEEFLPIIGAFAFAAIKLMPTAQMLFKDLSLVRFGRPAMHDLKMDLARLGQSVLPPDQQPVITSGTCRVELENVSFRYDAAETPSLSDISLDIPAGHIVGLAGGTGAGKTTIVDLLLGLITPSSGALRVDGALLTPDRLRAWQGRIGYVPQAINLIDATLSANITRGQSADTVDPARVADVASQAGLDEVIAGLPDGLDTMIGEAGVRLSGGQRQRIGIARALYRKHDLLVLDEATSALDAVTEAAVLNNIFQRNNDRTVIIITHRLQSLSMCDTIHFFERGKLTASGDLAHLEAVSPEFRAMRETGAL